MPDAFIRTYGVVIFLLDAAYERELAAGLASELSVAQRRARITDMIAHRRLVEWTVLIDGVYRIWCGLEGDATGLGLADDMEPWLVAQELDVPTGRLVLRSAGSEPGVLVGQFDPGRYQVSLNGSSREESEHFGLTEVSQYPENEGPDGVLSLCRLGGCSGL